jgi:hypothetical protein
MSNVVKQLQIYVDSLAESGIGTVSLDFEYLNELLALIEKYQVVIKNMQAELEDLRCCRGIQGRLCPGRRRWLW